MRHLVIGLGEVGKSLQEILQCDGLDRNDTLDKFDYDIIHICFPYSDKFEEQVRDYQRRYAKKYTVIHSTVPVGTSKKLNALHSPIRGKHPHLTKSIKTFVKYIGGEDAHVVAKEFEKYGITCAPVDDSKATEAGKLFSLMQYGVSILLNKKIHKYCQIHHIDFDIAYKDFNETYNAGYLEMGMPHVIRPILEYQEGKIGGHCVVQMMALLDMDIAKDIINENDKL